MRWYGEKAMTTISIPQEEEPLVFLRQALQAWDYAFSFCLSEDLDRYVPIGLCSKDKRAQELVKIGQGQERWLEALTRWASEIERAGIGSPSRVYLIKLMRATAAWGRGDPAAWPESS